MALELADPLTVKWWNMEFNLDNLEEVLSTHQSAKSPSLPEHLIKYTLNLCTWISVWKLSPLDASFHLSCVQCLAHAAMPSFLPDKALSSSTAAKDQLVMQTSYELLYDLKAFLWVTQANIQRRGSMVRKHGYFSGSLCFLCFCSPTTSKKCIIHRNPVGLD